MDRHQSFGRQAQAKPEVKGGPPNPNNKRKKRSVVVFLRAGFAHLPTAVSVYRPLTH